MKMPHIIAVAVLIKTLATVAASALFTTSAFAQSTERDHP
jgi:hypothetical protein